MRSPIIAASASTYGLGDFVFQRVLLVCLAGFLVSGHAVAQKFADDPALNAKLLQFEPETPERLVDAALMADRIDRPASARGYLAKLLGQNPSTAVLAELRRIFGPGVFLKLNSNPQLQPEARQLLLAVNDAVKNSAPSDQRLNELIGQLGADKSAAPAAILEILSAEDRAVVPLLSADPSTSSGRIADQTLRHFSRRLRHGLVAALKSSDPAARVRILQLLAATADPELIPELLRWQFDPALETEVSEAAAAAITRLGAMSSHPVPDSAESALVRLKQEVREGLKSAGRRFPPQDIPGLTARPLAETLRVQEIDRAVRLARDAAELAPDDLEALGLVTASRVAAGSGAIEEVPESQNETRPILITALGEALVTDNPTAAIGVLKLLLSTDGNAASADQRATPLRAVVHNAINSSDPRVRLLATQLMLTMVATEDGGSAVAQTLRSVAAGSLLPEAVVIDVDLERLNSLSVTLEDAGYATSRARTGAAGFDSAVRQMNCELILIHSNSIRWELSSTIANLRADIRTRKTPIVIYGPQRAERMSQDLAARYPGIWFISEPLGQLTLMPQLQAANVSGPLLTNAERAAMKAFVVRLAETRP